MTYAYVILGVFVLFVVAVGASRLRQMYLRRTDVLPSKGEESMDDVRRLLEDDRKTLAIKIYREIHNASLKDAKQAVTDLDKF